MASTDVTRVEPGQTVTLELPYSEVCMHMRVAGQLMQVTLLGDRGAQLVKDGRNFSAPILPSEAGLYRDAQGWYAHEVQS